MKKNLMIKVEHLVKKFNGLTAVDNIGFEIPKGEIFAFLGPNGAGKTTTIKMLTTLLRPTNGQILINGFDPIKNQIADQGIGISKEDLPNLFSRFYRSDKSRSKTNIPGYGLGLSIAKQIIDQHHGSVKVKSTLGKGSVFTISIPIHY